MTAVAFSPDGTLIATASADGTAVIWDTDTGAPLVMLIALSTGGYATLLADGTYKLGGDPGDDIWWAMKLCRFEPGELTLRSRATAARSRGARSAAQGVTRGE